MGATENTGLSERGLRTADFFVPDIFLAERFVFVGMMYILNLSILAKMKRKIKCFCK